MPSLVVPWNLASYIPLGGFLPALKDLLLSQRGVTLVRPEWPHERGYGGAFIETWKERQGPDFGRLAKFRSITNTLDLRELQLISDTLGDFEFHHSMPFSASGRRFFLFVTSIARMFQPFLFGDEIGSRRELEEAVPIYEEILTSDLCLGVLTPAPSIRASLERVFPGKGLREKFVDAPLIARPRPTPLPSRAASPTFVLIAKSAICDAFGRVSERSLYDCWCADMMGLAAFAAVHKQRPDARLIWLCPDWRRDPRRWSAAESPVYRWVQERAPAADLLRALSSLIDRGAVVVLCEWPADAELCRIMGRADFLLDLACEADISVMHLAMHSGCIPVLAATEINRELACDECGLLLELPCGSHVRSPLGFVEAYDQHLQIFAQIVTTVASSLAPLMQLIEAPLAAERYRHAMTRSFASRYFRFDQDELLLSAVRAKLSPEEGVQHDRQLAGASLVSAADFTGGPALLPEHRFDGLEIIVRGRSVLGTIETHSGAPRGRAPLPYADDRLSTVVQQFAELKILAKVPDFDAFPRLPVVAESGFEGGIDEIAGRPLAAFVRIGPSFTVRGWMALSAKEGIVPDGVYLVLTLPDGRQALVKADSAHRPDLVVHFGQPALRHAGFVATIDALDLPGHAELSLAYERGGRIARCDYARIIVYRGTSPPEVVDNPIAPSVENRSWRARVASLLHLRRVPETAPAIDRRSGVFDPFDASLPLLPEGAPEEHKGSIDTINGAAANLLTNIVSGGLLVRGWTSALVDGIHPQDAVLLRIEDSRGTCHYVRPRSVSREDVAQFFNQPKFLYSGFESQIDTAGLEGNCSIGVSILRRGTIICRTGIPVVSIVVRR